MKIAFFGTADFSSTILNDLIKNNDIDIKLVVSQPDKPIWRKQELCQTPVAQLATINNIELYQPKSVKPTTESWQNLITRLQELQLDFIVVVAYWKIIPNEILELPKFWCINIHWSLLPKYRWASPIQESIKQGDNTTWLTIMYMDERMDEWDILSTKEVEIWILDKTPEIFKKFEKIWAELLVDTLKKIMTSDIKPIKQDESLATYCTKIDKKDWIIDFENETVSQIYNKFRAFTPWPWIYSYYKWKKIEITDCFFELNDIYFDEDFSLWDVVEYENHWVNQYAVLCKWGFLILHKVKLEWKKEMDILSFVNGNKDFLEYNFLF